MKLPPYGKSIDKSNSLVWIWAGHYSHIEEEIKAWGENTCAFFTWLNPKEFYWPVEGRDVLIVSFMQPQDEWIKRLALTLLFSKAKKVAELMWRPQGYVIGEENITVTHYTRN